jgi:hypothetical protein
VPGRGRGGVRTSSHEGCLRGGKDGDWALSHQPGLAAGPLLSSQPHAAANHPEQPLSAILATPMSTCGAWPEPLPARRCSPFRLTSAHQPVGQGWPYRALTATAVPVARRLERRVDCPDQTWVRAPAGPRPAGRPAEAAAGYHRHLERTTAATRPAPWVATAAAPGPGSRLRCGHAPAARPRNPARPRLRGHLERSLALLTGLRDGPRVSQRR